MPQITYSVLGDCCVDNFVDEGKRFLGGTAFNVAYHAKQAGAQSTLLSAVGTDALGKKYIAACHTCHIATKFLTEEKGNTSTVDIIRTSSTDSHFANWDIGVLQERMLREEEKDFLKTQDIARAVLFKPVTALFESFVQLVLPHTVKVGDFLGSSTYSFRTDPIEKFAPNLDIVMKSVEEKETESLNFLHYIAQTYDTVVVALRGEKGSIVFTSDNTYQQDAFPTTVVNTTGAGDAYQAYFCYWYKKSGDIPKAMLEATKAATGTIQHLGASYQKEV